MQFSFFALVARMKYISRWALMRNTQPENLAEHAQETAVIAHALAVIGNARLGRAYHAERAALLGLYHDTAEILTGDMPTPVKYHDPAMVAAYKKVEHAAEKTLLQKLPDDMRPTYAPLLGGQKNPEDAPLWVLVKAADKLCALIKCLEEEKAGNTEFTDAARATRASLANMDCPEAAIFMEEFLPAYAQTLDEQK